MKRSFLPANSTTGILMVTLILILGIVPLCTGNDEKPVVESPSQEFIWDDENPSPEGPGRRMEGLIQRLEQVDPQRAEQLRKLRQEDPDRFQEEIRKEFQGKMQQGRRMGPGRPHHQDSPGPMRPGPGFRGPGGPGSGLGGPHQGRPDSLHDGRGMRGRWQEQLHKKHEEFIQWLTENYPEKAAAISELQEKEPQAYIMKVAELRKKYEPIIQAGKHNPRLAEVLKKDLELQHRRDEIRRQLRYAKDEERQSLLNELKTVIARRFDLILEKKQIQYEQLEKRLAKLQKELEKKKTELQKLQGTKEKAVEDRVKDLTNQSEKVEWD